MENWQFFLNRCLKSIEQQAFKDYEVILVKYGDMAITSNRTIESAKGEIIKVLYMDDYLTSPYSLYEIADGFKGGWLVTGCQHNDGKNIGNFHSPSTVGLSDKQNTIGSPSVLAFENNDNLMFDENMTWLLDVDLYIRLLERYGEPTILNTPNVTIGIGSHQTTNLLSDQLKVNEGAYLAKKYGN